MKAKSFNESELTRTRTFDQQELIYSLFLTNFFSLVSVVASLAVQIRTFLITNSLSERELDQGRHLKTSEQGGSRRQTAKSLRSHRHYLTLTVKMGNGLKFRFSDQEFH